MFGRYPHLLVRSIPSRSQSKAVDVARATVLKAGHTIYQFPFARCPSCRGRKVQVSLRLRCAEAALLACNERMLPKFLLEMAYALIAAGSLNHVATNLISADGPIMTG
jgi:hypothetical protein